MVNVLVAGQAVLDFIFEVEEIPSKPEKYRAREAQIVGGGCAANAAVAVARLGGAAHFAGRVGDDEIGRLIAEGLRAEGVNTNNLAQVKAGRSSYSAVHIDPAGERQIVNLRGAGLGDPTDWTLPPLSAVLADTRWDTGALAAFALARAVGIPAVLDGEAPVSPALAEAATHVVFSLQGIRDFCGTDELDTALRAASRQLPGWVAVTDGAAGVYHLEGGALVHSPAFAVDVVDTLGAGDVWHGAFTLALAEGQSERDAICFASATAALKCTVSGGRAGTPDRARVTQFLKDTP